MSTYLFCFFTFFLLSYAVTTEPNVGPHQVACCDLMTGYSKNGIFVRLYYPTMFSTEKCSPKVTKQWIPWVPHDKYIKGLAYVIGLWVFVIRLVIWWYGGNMHIPAIHEAKLLPKAQRRDKKLPVIIFSHGFGASRFFSSSLLTEIASHGHVVASVEHRDTSACATYYYKSPGKRDNDERAWIPHSQLQFGAKHYSKRNAQVKYRRDECIKALNLLEEINSGYTSSNILKLSLDLQDFKGELDLERVTIMGHSFGGATALMALNADPRFKLGVVLDGWMFPLKGEMLRVEQPLLFVNSPTFHIASNLEMMRKIISFPISIRQLFIIKTSTHETQTDSPFVLGYWLDLFKPKIDPHLGNRISNYLILKFLHDFSGTPEHVEGIEEELSKHSELVIEQQLPDPVPVKRAFSLTVFS